MKKMDKYKVKFNEETSIHYQNFYSAIKLTPIQTGK